MFRWGYKVQASMKGRKHDAKICLTSDGELCCCQCTWKVRGAEEDKTNPVNDDGKNMNCVHTFACLLKLTFMPCYFLSDDICYELGAKLTQKKIMIGLRKNNYLL